MVVGVALCCQKSQEEDAGLEYQKAFESLEANALKPFSVTWGRIERAGVQNPGMDNREYDMVKILCKGQKESAFLFAEAPDSKQEWDYLQIHSGEKRHAIEMEDPRWSLCGDWLFEGPLYAFGFYSPGGWDLCSQAIALVTEYEPTRFEAAGEQWILAWESVPETLSDQMLKTLDRPHWLNRSKLISFQLCISTLAGAPIWIDLVFDNGASMLTTYKDYSVEGPEYSTQLEKMRERIGATSSMKCENCGWSIEEVKVQ